MTDYYVDATGGNDGDDGLTEDTAWATLTKVGNSAFNPGDQVLSKRGEVWREVHFPPSAGVIYDAYGTGDLPRWSALDIQVGWAVYAGDTYKIDDVTTDPDFVVLDGTIIGEGIDEDNLNAEEWYYKGGADDELYFKTDGVTAIGDYVIETPIRNQVVNTFVAAGNSKSDLTFRNIQMDGSHQQAFKCVHAIDGLVLQDCVFKNCYFDAIFIDASSQAGAIDVTVNRCTFIDAHRFRAVFVDGSAATGTPTAKVRNCTITTVFYDGLAATSPDSDLLEAVHIVGCTDPIIFGNTVNISMPEGQVRSLKFEDGSGGIMEWNAVTGGDHACVLTNHDDGIVRYNIILNSGDDCIWIELSSLDAQVYYNIGAGSADDGIQINQGSERASVFNNVFAKNRDAGFLTEAPDGVCRNNIFYENGQPGVPKTGDEGGYEIRVATAAVATFVGDNNLFYHTTAKVTATPFYWDDTAYNFADWKTNSGQDANSKNANPLFVDEENDDYHIQGESLARDAGIDVGLERDLAGISVPQGSAPDMGAFEFVPSAIVSHGSSKAMLDFINDLTEIDEFWDDYFANAEVARDGISKMAPVED